MKLDIEMLLEKERPLLREWEDFLDQIPPEEEMNRGLSFSHRFLLHGAECSICSYLTAKSGDRIKAELERAEKAARILTGTLTEEGMSNSFNLASPPDTAFATERAGALLVLLRKKARPEFTELSSRLEEYLERTCDGLVTGGIHTPNHRWVVSSALSFGYHLLGKQSYKDRAEAWISEGIDIDEDGQFSERSTSIYSPVTVNCLLNMAEYLKKPELLEPVRRHLDLTLWFLKPDGNLVTTPSRRQDLFSPGSSENYYLPYLIMAVKDQNGAYGAAARFIAETDHLPRRGLTEILSGCIEGELPDPTLSLPLEGARFIAGSRFYRSLKENRFLTLFGGCDNGLSLKHASGLSGNPSFLSFQSGSGILESVRIAPCFFGTGYFRPDGMEREGDSWILEQHLSVPYFDTLKKDDIRADGDYSLTSSGRYWSKLDFPRRDRVNVQNLKTRAVIKEGNGGVELSVSVSGCPSVPVALEFAFPAEGELTGDWLESGDSPSFFEFPDQPRPKNMKILRRGDALYTCGEGKIRISGGKSEHDWLPIQQSGDYTSLDGEARKKQFVYVTLYSPFEITLEIGD